MRCCLQREHFFQAFEQGTKIGTNSKAQSKDADMNVLKSDLTAQIANSTAEPGNKKSILGSDGLWVLEEVWGLLKKL